MIPLNYNQLYYFFQIAEEGSISLASKKLLISSPALSMQLKELEETFGFPLFDRIGRRLVLTETGAVVLEYAKDIFKLGHELWDTIHQGTESEQKNKIYIGSQDTIPKEIAENLLTFLIQKKKCKVIMKEGNRDELIRLLNDYKLDLIITNSVPGINNSFIYESKLLIKDSLVILGHAKFKEAKGELQKISHIPFILPTYDSSLRQKVENYFLEKKLTLNVIAEIEDKSTEIDLAQKGMGLILMMKSMAQQLIQKKKLVELHEIKTIHEEVWMILGKRKIINHLAFLAMEGFTFLP